MGFQIGNEVLRVDLGLLFSRLREIFGENFEVSRNQIDFEVNRIPECFTAEGRLFERVGNDRNFEILFRQTLNGKAYAVDGNRTLLGKTFHEGAGSLKSNQPILLPFFDMNDPARSVDMAGHKMPAQLIAVFEGSFEVDAVPRPQRSQSRRPERFANDIGLESAADKPRNGQTNTVDGNAFSELDGAFRFLEAEHKVDGSPALLPPQHGSLVGDDSRIHAPSISRSLRKTQAKITRLAPQPI